jgi:hypothetical protein
MAEPRRLDHQNRAPTPTLTQGVTAEASWMKTLGVK